MMKREYKTYTERKRINEEDFQEKKKKAKSKIRYLVSNEKNTDNALQYLIQMRGYTQEDIAKKLKVERTTITSITRF